MNYGFLKANGTFTLNANRGITMGNAVPGIGASIQVNPGFTLTLAAPIAGPIGFISGSGEAILATEPTSSPPTTPTPARPVSPPAD